MNSIPPADHSGPSFYFSGVLAPQFADAFYEWLRSQVNELAEKPVECAPVEAVVDKDGTISVAYEYEGDQTDRITVTERAAKIHVSVQGDAEEINCPDSKFFASGRYSDDNHDAFGILDGEEYTIEELLKKLKRDGEKQ